MRTSLKQFDYEKLKECAQRGFLSENRVKHLLQYSPDAFEPEDFLFLERLLDSSSKIPDEDKRRTVLLLCHFRNPVGKYFKFLPENMFTSRFCSDIAEIAEKQNDPETVLGIADKNPNMVGLVITTLKRMRKQEYLTSFLFSNDESIVKLVKDMGEQ